MQKYLKWMHFFFLQSIEHRGELLVWVCLSIVPNIILLAIWQSAYGKSQVLNGYNLSQILQYFLFGTLINSLTSTHFEAFQSRQIREGKIDNAMTKPLSYPVQIFLRDIGGRAFYMILTLPIFICTYMLLMHIFQLSALHIPFVAVLQFFILMVFGYWIEFSFAFATVLLTFWFEGAEGLEHFKWIIITIFSGWMIPVAFMPQWLQKAVAVLPFKYMYAIPIDILQGRALLQITDLVLMSVSAIVLFLALSVLWRKAVYKYSSAGG
jgi:ABC-2 type transport system permease protein